MNIAINIQSYKRAGAVETLELFPEASLWVHEFEANIYRAFYPLAKVRVLPDETRGNLPKVKNFILDESRNADACLFLDDDIRSIDYWQQNKRIAMTGDVLRDFIIKHTIIADEWGLKLWGVNVNNDKQCYREYSPFSTLSYVSSSFACFLRGNQLRYDERFPLKEDYDMTIQQCMKYRGVLRVNRAYYYKKSMENVGGCGMYRNVEREKAQLELLQKKWGTEIVQSDSLTKSRNHLTTKKRAFDINPVIRIPIAGI